MQRRDFLKSSALLAATAGAAAKTAKADVPAHNWGKYDFGSGPKITDRLNQGPFPQYPPTSSVGIIAVGGYCGKGPWFSRSVTFGPEPKSYLPQL